MNPSDWKLCEGCNVFTPPDNCLQRTVPIIRKNKCPCISCLIKMACTNECEDFSDYRRLARRIWNENIQNQYIKKGNK